MTTETMSNAEQVASMSDVKLEPCPFCGGAGEIDETEGGQASSFAPHYRGNCSQYGCANMVWTTEKAEAIAAWNQRHQPQREAVLEEAVRQALLQVEKYAEFFCEEDFDPLVDQLRAALTTPAPAVSRDEIAAVFSENLPDQAARLGVHHNGTESPGQWRDRVRKAAILSRLRGEGE